MRNVRMQKAIRSTLLATWWHHRIIENINDVTGYSSILMTSQAILASCLGYRLFGPLDINICILGLDDEHVPCASWWRFRFIELLADVTGSLCFSKMSQVTWTSWWHHRLFALLNEVMFLHFLITSKVLCFSCDVTGSYASWLWRHSLFVPPDDISGSLSSLQMSQVICTSWQCHSLYFLMLSQILCASWWRHSLFVSPDDISVHLASCRCHIYVVTFDDVTVYASWCSHRYLGPLDDVTGFLHLQVTSQVHWASCRCCRL